MLKQAAKIGLCAVALVLSGSLFAAEAQFHRFSLTASDGKDRPYIVYTPAGVAADEKRPLLVYLHGAVSSPDIPAEPLDKVRRSSFLKLADAGRYLVLFPFGQKGAAWFDSVGTDMVFKQINEVEKQFAVDADKVFMSGFSDGASGTLYLAATHPERFAGFIALNGSLPVAAHLGESPVYPENINHKPLYMINTQGDMLYPAAMMRPVVDFLRQRHSRLAFQEPEGNHNMAYLEQVLPELRQFVEQNSRHITESLVWESSVAPSGTDWLRIVRLAPDKAAKPWHGKNSLKMFNGKASFGMKFDPAYKNGLKVAETTAKGTAAKMGVQPGDIILKMGDTVMNHAYAPYRYLAGKKAGDETELTVARQGRELVLKGRFNPGYQYEVFEKQPVSGKIRATLQGGKLVVETSRIAAFSIDFDRLPNRGGDMTLVVDGKAGRVVAKGVQTFEVP
ncbi:PDZ domain-containing protein [Neisseria weaveri]|uniref:Poly(3-hydroxybutyrate) depolymerase n=1 Tax=Neisseria weaveri TaxID=28091 RepID=A0A448VNA9_9NEIS|nr:PDZ domain-containing protein [Neisseria weaveri]EGV36830.1 hypothetical protein l11_15800 [Neisseria weaveri LMG 5135]EGV37313.1 hypothetical protein l13_04250 [Neisseria weaveri ATCC 51223]SAY51767.1 Poly(3-hydroxybutyrate) depolymerase [Neisseria weaveri]VEJ51164.1 Poly(3-hydroxybutyrate) depolymerase [Neisseria weaveri]